MPGIITEFASKRSATCELVSVAGSALKLRAPLQLALRATVKVEEGNRLWLGAVCACEPEPGGFFIEIEADAMLRDVAGTKQMANRFRRPTLPEAEREAPARVSGRRELPG